jgi:hypothetical protein
MNLLLMMEGLYEWAPMDLMGQVQQNRWENENQDVGQFFGPGVFSWWCFQLITTAREKGKPLTGHISPRTRHHRPHSVTCVTVFCDESLFSGPPDSDGLISVASELQGFVQTQNSTLVSTKKKWIDSA